jgi:hypothetical protein
LEKRAYVAEPETKWTLLLAVKTLPSIHWRVLDGAIIAKITGLSASH